MATTVHELTDSDWSKVADGGESFTLSLISGRRVTYAVTDTDVAPTIPYGHTLSIQSNQGTNRDLTGPGYVWVRRLITGLPTKYALTKWL